jgi:hypothetical protein
MINGRLPPKKRKGALILTNWKTNFKLKKWKMTPFFKKIEDNLNFTTKFKI